MKNKRKVSDSAVSELLPLEEGPKAERDSRQDGAKEQSPAPKKNGNESKMTIYEYEQRYVKGQNVRAAGRLLRFLAAILGAGLFVIFCSLFLRIYEINEWAGLISGAALLIAYVIIYIIPVSRILGMSFFETQANFKTAKASIKHNRKLRKELAQGFVDFTAKAGGAGWYDGEIVARLAACLSANDNEGIKAALTELYGGSVRKTANKIILKSSVKCGTMSALSQSERLDTAIVIAVNIQLVRDICFLYGFRPSDAKLTRIFLRVVQSALVAYGIGGANIGNGIVKTMGDAVRDIPLLGSAISTVVDSSVQGLANATLTTVIGYQTVKYLNREYRLQDILDGVELVSDEQIEETCRRLKKQLKDTSAA